MAKSLPQGSYSSFEILLSELFNKLYEGGYIQPHKNGERLSATSAYERIIKIAEKNFTIFKGEIKSEDDEEWINSVINDCNRPITNSTKSELSFSFSIIGLSNIHVAYIAQREKSIQMRIVHSLALSLGYKGWEGYDTKNEKIPNCIRLVKSEPILTENQHSDIDDQKIDIIQSGVDEIKEIVRDIKENKTSIIPKELTVKFPKLWKKQIVGRTSDIEDLRRRLFDNKQVVLVNGMGGIGKTTIGAVYATENLSVYSHIAWISQLSDSFINDFVNTPGLAISLKITIEGKTLDELFNEIIMALKSLKNSPCLMVIDNANEELSRFYDLLPSQPNWHILATSREVIPHFDIKELGFLSEEESIELFETYYKRKDIKKNDVKRIVKYLDYHTLTIEILALTAQAQGLSTDDILSSIEENIQADVIIKHSKDKIEKITSYLCFVFKKISIVSKDEKWLLKQLACIPSEFHQYDELRKLIRTKGKGLHFRRLLSSLSTKGWLLYNQTTDSYKMHQIIIDVTSRSLSIDIETVSPLIATITDKLSIDQRKDSFIEKVNWVAYGESILKQLKIKESISIALLQNHLGLIIYEMGDYFKAKELFEKALNTFKVKNREGFKHLPGIYNNLGLALVEIAEYKDAILVFEEAISIYENNPIEADTGKLTCYVNLAMVYRNTGDFKEAKRKIDHAISAYKNNHGIDGFTIMAYSQLAFISQELGEFERAKELLEEVIAFNEKKHGENHIRTVKNYSHFATILTNLEEFERAKRFAEIAVNYFEDIFDLNKDHRILADCYSILGEVMLGLHEYEECKLLFEKSTKIFVKILSEDHPYTANSYHKLATVHFLLGDYNKAKQLLEKSIIIEENYFGLGRKSTFDAYSLLADTLQEMGEIEEAIARARETIMIAEKVFGPNHPTTRFLKSNFGLVPIKNK